MLEALTVLLMLLIGFLHFREGMFAAAIMFFNVILGGLLAFNFFEPLAGALTSMAPAMDPYADCLALLFLFLLCVGLLRLVTGFVTPNELGFPGMARQIGGAVFGLLTGYFIAGILIATFQTLPWEKNFLGYDAKDGIGMGSPDRVWLRMVGWASENAFRWPNVDQFNAEGYVERYATRRAGEKDDKGKPSPSPNPQPENPPATDKYAGQWTGEPGREAYEVSRITISKDDFPCPGKITLKIDKEEYPAIDVTWELKEGQVHASVDGKPFARATLADDMLSGVVFMNRELIPNFPADGPKELKFSKLKRGSQ